MGSCVCLALWWCSVFITMQLFAGGAEASSLNTRLCACQIDNQRELCAQQIQEYCVEEGYINYFKKDGDKVGVIESSQDKAYWMCLDYHWLGAAGVSNLSGMSSLNALAVSMFTCKHATLFNTTELLNMISAANFAPYKPLFEQNYIDGPTFIQLTEDHLTGMGMPVGHAMHMIGGLNSLLTPTIPTTLKKGPLLIQLAAVVTEVFNIDETRFEFQCAFTIVMHWTDPNMFSDCRSRGDTLNEGGCKYLWRPKLKFLNVREESEKFNVMGEFLWNVRETQTVAYQINYEAKLSSPMSFVEFPQDTQELPISFAIREDVGLRTQVRFHELSSSLNHAIASHGKREDKDTMNGWTLAGTRIEEKPYLDVDINRIAGESGPLRETIEKLKSFYESHNMDADIQEVNTFSSATVYVIANRTSTFYVLNYIVIVFLLTALGSVVFFISPKQLDARASISLTLMLALNVFQVLLGEFMPKTSYLTPMHQFVLISTFFVATTLGESLISHLLDKRAESRSAVVRRLQRLALEDSDEDSDKGIDTERPNSSAPTDSTNEESPSTGNASNLPPYIPRDSNTQVSPSPNSWTNAITKSSNEKKGKSGKKIIRSKTRIQLLLIETFIEKHIDKTFLYGYPIIYAIYTTLCFHFWKYERK